MPILIYGYIQCVRTNFIIAAANALGIGAASFASAVYEASKDIAESPTACRNALLLKFTINN